MSHIKYLIMLIIVLLAGFYLYADKVYEEITAWEPEDIEPIYKKLEIDNKFEPTLIKLLFNNLINWYQSDISSNTIKRCPFFISCSNFAQQAITQYGFFIGICFFIDRNLYREHNYSSIYYFLRESDTMLLLLDDSYYIYGEKTIDGY